MEGQRMTGTSGPIPADEGPGIIAAEPVRSEVTRQAVAVAVACAICMGFGFAPIFFGTFPQFLEPVSRQFQWSAAIFPQAMLISGVTGALSGPLVGRLIDKLGVRKVLLPGLVAWAATLVAMSFLNGSLVMLYVVSALMGPLAATCGPVGLAKVVSSWFDRSRGVALSAILGGSVAIFTALMLVVARALIIEIGWRETYLVLAGSIVLIALPVSYFLLREAPHSVSPSMAMMPGSAVEGVKPTAAFTSRAFWTVMLSSTLVCASCSGVVSHFVPWSAERAVSPGIATFALTLYSLVGPFAALIAGAAADRLRRPGMLAIVFMVPLIGFLAMLTSQDWAVIIGLTMMGAGFAAVAGLLPFFTSRYFGLANASTIFGVAIGLTTLSLGIGPVLLGVLRDKWGAYAPGSPIVVGALILGAVLAASFPPYPRSNGGETSP
ncbi:major facilitator superfamily MFS_1 [Caulobacter segnis ATCC 21756]|uniref:Major facilitator superfamily MFS_1 n=2 Tax=Caulobacter segnis TaxID=88688 RepID=D5VGA8_CAUST|nr:major facilitator superfamily MFS_1 [Caulobacter segnis ATCC 21756]